MGSRFSIRVMSGKRLHDDPLFWVNTFRDEYLDRRKENINGHVKINHIRVDKRCEAEVECDSSTQEFDMPLQFSPGPFEISHSVSGDFFWIEDDNGRTICDFYIRSDDCRPDPIFRFDHAEANARLFGHALEMHDFLTELAAIKPVYAATATWAQSRALVLLAKIHNEKSSVAHPSFETNPQVSHIS